mmetsp:Transcript_5500/g.9892  ORF Transcript_5500/g.9892 Transcript_5500/m.9892 type:complete len:191 (+) Transcript_5500:659-1231(+)
MPLLINKAGDSIAPAQRNTLRVAVKATGLLASLSSQNTPVAFGFFPPSKEGSMSNRIRLALPTKTRTLVGSKSTGCNRQNPRLRTRILPPCTPDVFKSELKRSSPGVLETFSEILSMTPPGWLKTRHRSKKDSPRLATMSASLGTGATPAFMLLLPPRRVQFANCLFWDFKEYFSCGTSQGNTTPIRFTM